MLWVCVYLSKNRAQFLQPFLGVFTVFHTVKGEEEEEEEAMYSMRIFKKDHNNNKK